MATTLKIAVYIVGFWVLSTMIEHVHAKAMYAIIDGQSWGKHVIFIITTLAMFGIITVVSDITKLVKFIRENTKPRTD